MKVDITFKTITHRNKLKFNLIKNKFLQVILNDGDAYTISFCGCEEAACTSDEVVFRSYSCGTIIVKLNQIEKYFIG